MKEEIIEKINAGITEAGYDAILVFGNDNVQYLSGAYLHFPQSFPDRYMAIFWPKEAQLDKQDQDIQREAWKPQWNR